MKYTECLNECCFFTGLDKEYCETHHIFFGRGLRKLSEKYGMKVYLSPECHRGSRIGVHHNRKNNLTIKRYAQHEFEKTHTREEFIKIFGKSYL